MKNKSLNTIIPYQLYPFDVMFSLGETDEQLTTTINKHLKDYPKDDIDEMTRQRPGQQGFCMMFSGGATLIRIYKYPKSCNDYATLQHEIFHAVEFLMNRIGVKHSLECGEVYAYAIQYLTEQIYRKL